MSLKAPKSIKQSSFCFVLNHLDAQAKGAAGFVQVEAVLLDGTNAQKTVILNGFLLAGNAWSRGPTSNTNWAGDPDMLEKP